MSAVVRAFRQFDTEDALVTLLASIVVAAREFIGIADLDGRALFVNEAGRKLVGLSDLQAVRSTRIVDYFTAADQPRVLEQVMPAVRSAGFWQGKLEFRNFATGQPVPVLYNIFRFATRRARLPATGPSRAI
ncbi:MAG: PAS domain-containing protein [Pseudorhodoplanes sp.]|nr:PAS domain-containing protein [Pseudorhodoplanes sp.]